MEALTTSSWAVIRSADSLAEFLGGWQSYFYNYNHSCNSNNKSGHLSCAFSVPCTMQGVLQKPSHWTLAASKTICPLCRSLGFYYHNGASSDLPLCLSSEVCLWAPGIALPTVHSAWGLGFPSVLSRQCRCMKAQLLGEWDRLMYGTLLSAQGHRAGSPYLALAVPHPLPLPQLPLWVHVLGKSPAHESSSASGESDLRHTQVPWGRPIRKHFPML